MSIKNTNFYNSPDYRQKQSFITKNNWRNGVYDSRYKREKRKCVRKECKIIFEVTRKEIEKMYNSGLSMMEISKKIDFKYGTIVHSMKKFNIPRRSLSEAIYLKHNPNGDPFKIKEKLNQKEILLKGLGLGLYWGEGDKSNNNTSRKRDL